MVIGGESIDQLGHRRRVGQIGFPEGAAGGGGHWNLGGGAGDSPDQHGRDHFVNLKVAPEDLVPEHFSLAKRRHEFEGGTRIHHDGNYDPLHHIDHLGQGNIERPLPRHFDSPQKRHVFSKSTHFSTRVYCMLTPFVVLDTYVCTRA